MGTWIVYIVKNYEVLPRWSGSFEYIYILGLIDFLLLYILTIFDIQISSIRAYSKMLRAMPEGRTDEVVSPASCYGVSTRRGGW